MFSEIEMKIVLELAIYQIIEMMNTPTSIANRTAFEPANMTLNQTIMLEIFTSHLNHLLPQKDLIQKS
jgi:hypothetical protein